MIHSPDWQSNQEHVIEVQRCLRIERMTVKIDQEISVDYEHLWQGSNTNISKYIYWEEYFGFRQIIGSSVSTDHEVNQSATDEIGFFVKYFNLPCTINQARQITMLIYCPSSLGEINSKSHLMTHICTYLV